MADLVTSESRRYLHGFQRNINEVSELQYIVPVDNQVTYIDSFTNYGFDTVYGDEYVISASEGNDPRIQEALNLATTVQAAIDELDSEKGGLAQDNTWAGSNTFTQALTALQFVKSGGTSGQFLKADGSLDSSSYETTITAGTTSQYYRGDKTWQALDTAAVTESTNLYFTNARVLSTALTGLNTSLTGAVAASDTILAALGKLENRVSGFSAAGVSSFNTRTGAVTLTSGDVTGALGFAPSPKTHTHTFASLTSKPTTLSGYGITDAASSTHNHPASSISNTPAGNIAANTVQAAINELDSEKVAANTAITGATKTKITYDSKGLVTAGADATASEITNTPVAPITSTNVQGALNEVASLADSASSAASAAQSTANNAASAAAYADRLARSNHNLIKNGNSEDPNPTGWEAAWISDSGAYTGTKCRAVTVADAGGWPQTTVGEAPCDPGDQFVFSAWGKQATANSKQHIFIEFLDAAGGRVGIALRYFPASTAYTRAEVSSEAPAGTVKVRFVIYVDKATATTYYWDCLYAARKVSAWMLEADAIRSTTSDFNVTSTTASTSTTTGAVVVTGGVASGDFFTGKYRSSDGSAGLTATRTFYAASSSGGATNVLNTVTIKDGIITSWTQA